MSSFQAAILGLVQGLGEFLPISSSAHLIIVPWLLGWAEHSLAFDVALHVGTLVAVLFAFARDWRRLISATLADVGAGRPFSSPDSRLLGILVVSSIPAAIAGLLFEDLAEHAFRSPAVVAANMVLLGAVLLVADYRADAAPPSRPVTLAEGFAIGLAQSVAIIPGVSRAGATITVALLLGHRRADSARFSFLLATPIVFGAAAVKVPSLIGSGAWGSTLVGVTVSAVVGLLSIRFVLGHVRTKTYRPFVYYRWVFAAIVVAALLLGWKAV